MGEAIARDGSSTDSAESCGGSAETSFVLQGVGTEVDEVGTGFGRISVGFASCSFSSPTRSAQLLWYGSPLGFASLLHWHLSALEDPPF